MEKAKTLKKLLTNSSSLDFALEAHDAVSARIVEEAGFRLIWASGLTIATALGHRDSNELSWTQLCAHWEYMAESTNIPILVDADTGFGNFNNVRMLVKKLSRIEIAGLCIEDKLFPKTNSFIGENQPLANINEFCGKIRAGKDTNPLLNIVARTEAFIAGRGLEEALERAYAYEEAGADAILIHSKQKTATEIRAFCARWEGKCPLVIVPTKYTSEPTLLFETLGISLVIWANHLLRSSIASMREAAKQISATQSVAEIEMATLEEVFSLVNQKELQEAESLYLP